MNDINGSRLSRRLTQLGQIGFMPGKGPHDCPIRLSMTRGGPMYSSAWSRQDSRHPWMR